MIKTSIIILVHDILELIDFSYVLLFSLSNEYEVIVINTGKKELVKNPSATNFRYFKYNNDYMFSGGCNYGIQQAIGENVIFINNDVRLESRAQECFDTLVSSLTDNNLVALNGGMLTKDFNFIRETDKVIDYPYFYLSGWCIAAKRKVWDKLTIKDQEVEGPWNTKTPFYFSDPDLSFRAKQQKIDFKIISLLLKHYGKMTAEKVGVAKLYQEGKKQFTEIWKGKI